LIKLPVNYQTAGIVATMIVMFAGSYAIMSPRRQSFTNERPSPQRTPERRESPSDGPYPRNAAAISARVSGGIAAVNIATAAPTVQGKPKVITGAVIDTTVPSENHDGPPLPVMFNIINKRMYTAEESVEGVMQNFTRQVNEAVIFNSSGEALTITVLDVDVPTQQKSQAQFVLMPGAQKHFGVDQGLKMQSGDQITLRCAGFHDLESQIP